jgi:signal transduction histidine kinase
MAASGPSLHASAAEVCAMSLQNLSPLDRAVRLLAGALLLWWGWTADPAATEIWPAALRIFGWLPLVTGLLGWCPFYAMLGLSTRKPKPSRATPEALTAHQEGPEFSYNAPAMEPRGIDAALSTRRLRRLKWAAVLAALAFILLFESVRQSLQPLHQTWSGRLLLDGVLLTGALFFIGAVFQLIERMQGRLDDLHRRLHGMAVSEERLRISQEMHDGLAQVLAYVNTKAQVVREHLKRERTDEATKHLDQLAAAAREVYDDVRESIIGLRSAAVPGRSAADSLRDYAATWEAESGITCRLHLETDVQLPAGAELQVQRIVQEALTNVRKHSRARHADVRIERADNHIRITVEDDGVGFSPAELGRSELPRFGLSSMRERAESVGGLFQLDSTPGEGTRVTIEVPTQTPIRELSRGAVS